MPEYSFKCKKCKAVSKFEYKLREIAVIKHDAIMQECKRCKAELRWTDVLIEFAGGINMNNSVKAQAYRKYSNKQGGPQAIVNGKIIGRRD